MSSERSIAVNHPHLTAAEILEKAAEYIEVHGWVQGGTGGILGGPACIARSMKFVGSPGCSAFDGSGITPEHKAAIAAVNEYLGIGGTYSIPHWNDEPGRTKEEVCRMLRSVAARLDGRYGPSDAPGSTDTPSEYKCTPDESGGLREAYTASVDSDPLWEERVYQPI